MSQAQLHTIAERLQERGSHGDRELAAVGRAVDNYVDELDRRLALANRVSEGLYTLAGDAERTEQSEVIDELGLVGDEERLIQYLQQARDRLVAEVQGELEHALPEPM
jgi:hypothetical protein